MAQPVLPVLSTTAPTPPHLSSSSRRTGGSSSSSRHHQHHQNQINNNNDEPPAPRQPPPVFPRTVRLSSRDSDDYYLPSSSLNQPQGQGSAQKNSPDGGQNSGNPESTFWQHHTPFDTPVPSSVGSRLKKHLDLSASADARMLSVSPPKDSSTPNVAGATPSGVPALHILTDMQGSSMSHSSGFHANDTRSPPSSVQTSSSYRSPTKGSFWTNFEDEEDSEAESTGTSHASPTQTANHRFSRLDSHSSGPVSVGQGVGSVTGLSADLETRNLLDADAFSEADAQSLCEEDPYVMSDEQRIYYLENFKQLQKATQSAAAAYQLYYQHTSKSIDLGGAIRGADEKVIDFFRKSNLGQDLLWKIWQLADVNQDGWLNLDEFCTAMHLIVLFVKGNVPVPDYLPPHIAPPLTPPRGHPDTTTPDAADAQVAGGWQNFEEGTGPGAVGAGGGTKSGDGVAVGEEGVMGEEGAGRGMPPLVDRSPQLGREFTSVPPPSGGVGGAERPVPVKISPDTEEAVPGSQPTTVGFYKPVPTPPRRPRGGTNEDLVYPPGPPISAAQAAALKKASTLPVSPAVPKGPPPKPPPRPPHRHGHARSASLDLTKGMGFKKEAYAPSNNLPPPEPSPSDIRSPPGLPPSGPPSSAHTPQADTAATPSTTAIPDRSLSFQPEPASLPPLPCLPVRDIETQTEPFPGGEDWPDAGLTRNRLSGIPPIIDLGDEEDPLPPKKVGERGEGASSDTQGSVEGGGQGPPLDWKGRCRKLERANEELEKERVKLAETRLYLELQLQKLKG